MIWESFFDDSGPESEKFNLWKRNDPAMKLEKHEILHSGQLLKSDKDSATLKERLFVLTKDHLYYTRDDIKSPIRGVMELKFVRVSYFQDDSSSSKYSLRFMRNQKFCDLYVNADKDYMVWKQALAGRLIQTDFHTKFGVIKMIGKGSFAKVYLVNNKEDDNKQYAVKAFSKEFLMTQNKGKESLINEIDIMQKVKHPNIINLYEVHESKNSIYLVIEYQTGGELFQKISDAGSLLKLESIVKIMRGILLGLQYLEAEKILHRDLKPENLILISNNTDLMDTDIKIVDFGLATQADVEDYLFKRCGTPGFVAPEIISANANDKVKFSPKCDIFSAGVIFYILVTGTTPFKGKDFKDILKANRDCKIDYQSKQLKDKDPRVIDLLQKMQVVDANKRCSAKEALDSDQLTDKSAQDKQMQQDLKEDLKDFQDKYKNDIKRVKENMKNNKNPEEVPSIEMRFNKYEGGVNESGKSIASDNNSFRQGGEGDPISPSKKGTTSLHKQALMNKTGGQPQIDSFRSGQTMRSDTGSAKNQNTKDGGEKTSLHDVDVGGDDGDELKQKKVSSFQKEAMSPDRKKAPGSPLKKQLNANE